MTNEDKKKALRRGHHAIPNCWKPFSAGGLCPPGPRPGLRPGPTRGPRRPPGLICWFAFWICCSISYWQPWCRRHNKNAPMHLIRNYSLFVCFVALRPKSTAMVIAGPSVHLTTLFPVQAWTSSYPRYLVHILSLATDNNPSWMIQGKGGEWP